MTSGAVFVEGTCGYFGPPRPCIVFQKSVFFLSTDGYGLAKTPHPSSVPDGMGGPTPPSVIRSGWYGWVKSPSVHRNVTHRHRTHPSGWRMVRSAVTDAYFLKNSIRFLFQPFPFASKCRLPRRREGRIVMISWDFRGTGTRTPRMEALSRPWMRIWTVVPQE